MQRVFEFLRGAGRFCSAGYDGSSFPKYILIADCLGVGTFSLGLRSKPSCQETA